MKKLLENALGYKNLVTRFNTTQINFKKEDMKYKTVKIFSLKENLLQKISSSFNK